MITRNTNLDAWRNPERDVRIQVESWHPIQEVAGQFIEHPRSAVLLFNYLRRVGVRAVWHKLRSRLKETVRNQKVAAIGSGWVMEAPSDVPLRPGDPVVFFAPNHPRTPHHICLDALFVVPFPDIKDTSASVAAFSAAIPHNLLQYIGWSPFSGLSLNEAAIAESLRTLAHQYALKPPRPDAFVKEQPRESYEFASSTNNLDAKPSVVLFGLGNYAKTQILPNIRQYLSLRRVHEVDPDQLRFFGDSPRLSLDTSPLPRDGARFDAWFIAGYHHTHADLATSALRQGAYAVIEKPLATTRAQYETLLEAISRDGPSRFFACFHKRYSELHRWAMQDLDKAPAEPVDMHCVVYEIPLPPLHWYNWPNSGSRLISNGCHWIDYFMFVNDYSKVADCQVWCPRGSDVCVQVRLENSAYFVMSLTDTGSQRLGVRDHIELRKGNVTVKMVDASAYESENRTRILRRKTVNPMNAYARMYRTISKTIAAKGPGDSLASLRSTELTLLMEEDARACS